jgi:hypothetical protein
MQTNGSFIDLVTAKNFTQAEAVFKTAMAEKVTQALDARRIQIAQNLYAKAQ